MANTKIQKEFLDDELLNDGDIGSTVAPIASPTFTGMVGIGTSSPTRRLSVEAAGSSIVASFKRTDTTSGFMSFSGSTTTNDSTVGFGADVNDAIFRAGNVERVRIASNGNVGIGTTTPSSKLEVVGTTTTDIIAYDQAVATASAVGNTGTSQTVDASTATIFTYTLNGNCAFTFSNFTSGRSIELHLYGDGTGGYTPTFPTAKTLYNNTTIAYPTNTTDLLVLKARHNGTEVVITAAGNYAAFS